jgi:hypothetical protein
MIDRYKGDEMVGERGEAKEKKRNFTTTIYYLPTYTLSDRATPRCDNALLPFYLHTTIYIPLIHYFTLLLQYDTLYIFIYLSILME